MTIDLKSTKLLHFSTSVENANLFEYSGKLQIGALCYPYTKEQNCGQPVEQSGIKKIFIHPNYNKANNEYDVALIRLEKESLVKPVEIDQTGISTFYNKEQKLFVAGLGKLQYDDKNGDLPDRLRHVELSYVPGQDCLSTFNETSYHFNPRSMMCARDEGKDACQGKIESKRRTAEQ